MRFAERHCVLVADDRECTLGAMALRLTRIGLDPIYTNDADEAVLLAAQEAKRLGAIAFPVSRPVDELDHMIKSVAERAGIQPDAMIPVGPRPNETEMLVALRERGIRWAVWDPYDDSDLRFVLSAVLARRADADLRLEPRVPAHGMRARLYKGRLGRDVVVIDLSVSGAFLASDKPMPEDTVVSLELTLGARTMTIRSRVRWVRRDPDAERWDLSTGMGVEFEDVKPEQAAELRRFVQTRTADYVVTTARTIG